MNAAIEAMRLFLVYSAGNFIEATRETCFFQIGESKYGKPVIDRVVHRGTSLLDATKCTMVSFDSTMRSNISVGMPIDLLCYSKDSLKVTMKRRFDSGDAYFALGDFYFDKSDFRNIVPRFTAENRKANLAFVDTVRRVEVGHIIATLKDAGRQHAPDRPPGRVDHLLRQGLGRPQDGGRVGRLVGGDVDERGAADQVGRVSAGADAGCTRLERELLIVELKDGHGGRCAVGLRRERHEGSRAGSARDPLGAETIGRSGDWQAWRSPVVPWVPLRPEAGRADRTGRASRATPRPARWRRRWA